MSRWREAFQQAQNNIFSQADTVDSVDIVRARQLAAITVSTVSTVSALEEKPKPRPEANAPEHRHNLWLWTAGLDRLRGHPPPPGFSEHDWNRFRLDALALLHRHGPQLAALGWTTLDLFGLHRTHPGARVDASGIARFLHGGSLVVITGQHVRIRRLTGSELTYCRIDPPPGLVPAWELQPPTEDI